MKHDAIHQEGKDMGGGRMGTSQEGQPKSSIVAVFNLGLSVGDVE